MSGNIGVHKTHCCRWHGCKYCDEACPVASGKASQDCLCDDCYAAIAGIDGIREELRIALEIKEWAALDDLANGMPEDHW